MAQRLGISRTEYLRRTLERERASTGDHVTVAELAQLVVLHVDKDFDLVADVTGQPIERLAVL